MSSGLTGSARGGGEVKVAKWIKKILGFDSSGSCEMSQCAQYHVSRATSHSARGLSPSADHRVGALGVPLPITLGLSRRGQGGEMFPNPTDIPLPIAPEAPPVWEPPSRDKINHCWTLVKTNHSESVKNCVCKYIYLNTRLGFEELQDIPRLGRCSPESPSCP